LARREERRDKLSVFVDRGVDFASQSAVAFAQRLALSRKKGGFFAFSGAGSARRGFCDCGVEGQDARGGGAADFFE